MCEQYFAWLENTATDTGVKWTSPYVDAAGLGLVITASLPVRDASGTLLGVVGIDSTLQTLENAVTGTTWGQSYSFLTNTYGEAIVHPLLKPSFDVTTDPQYPNIATLETVEGDPAAFDDVVADLLAGTANERTFATVRRIPRGDADAGFAFVPQTSRYKYAPLPQSDLMITIVARDPDDLQFRVLNEPAAVADPAFFHRLDLYEAQFPALYPQLGVQVGAKDDPLRPGLTFATQQSTVFMSTPTNCRSDEYGLDLADSNFATIHAFLNDDVRVLLLVHFCCVFFFPRDCVYALLDAPCSVCWWLFHRAPAPPTPAAATPPPCTK